MRKLFYSKPGIDKCRVNRDITGMSRLQSIKSIVRISVARVCGRNLLTAFISGAMAAQCVCAAPNSGSARDALKAQADAMRKDQLFKKFAGETAIRLEDWLDAAGKADANTHAAQLENEMAALAPKLAHAIAELTLGEDGWQWKADGGKLAVCQGKPDEVGTVLGVRVSLGPDVEPRIVSVQLQPRDGALDPAPPKAAKFMLAPGVSRYLFYQFAAPDTGCAKAIEVLADEGEAGLEAGMPGTPELDLPLELAGQIDLEAVAPAMLELKVTDAGNSKPTQARVFIAPTDGGPFWGKFWGNARFSAIWGEDRQKCLNYGATFQYTDTNGILTAALRPGKYRVTIQKGKEYAHIEKETSIAAGEKREMDVPLARWIHAAELGWYSGDPHVHLRRLAGDDEGLFQLMEVEDLNVMTPLYCSCFHSDRPVVCFGPESEAKRGERVLSTGEEYRNAYAHFDFLNLRNSPTFHFQGTPDKFGGKMPEGQEPHPSISVVADWVREQGGEMLFAHGIPPGGILYVAAGRCCLFEELQWLSLRSTEEWYRILNAGYRLFGKAGTDAPNFNAPGTDRVYVKCAGELSFANWLAAMKAGHSFMTTGPILLLTVNGRIPGDELLLEAKEGAATVDVRVRAACDFPLSEVELIRNGEAIRAWAPLEGKLDWEIEEQLTITDSCWLAARTSGEKGLVKPLAHTNPVFVLVDGKPIWDQTANTEIIRGLQSRLGSRQQPFIPQLTHEQRRESFDHWVVPGLKVILRRQAVPPGVELEAGEEKEMDAAIEEQIQAFRDAFGAGE